MARNAEAAGFNPLTALRNGGAAGFTTTTSPGLSAPERIGEAMGHVGNFLADFDPYKDQKREAEYRLVQAQIANLNAQTASIFPPAPGQPGSFNVPSYLAGDVKRAPKTAALSVGGPVEMGDRTVTNPWTTQKVDPHLLDAEAFEARYGDSEAAQTIFGARNLIADGLYNINERRKAADKYWEPRTGALLSKRDKENKERRKSREERLRKAARENARALGFIK